MGTVDEIIASVLKEAKTIAVVGLSPNETRASNRVARYLLASGYTIIPVNPGQTEILGQKCFSSLLDITIPVDIVDIFMRSEKLLPVVEEAVRIHPKCIWLQLGIVNEDAKKLSQTNDIFFVQDRCVKIEHTRLAATP